MASVIEFGQAIANSPAGRGYHMVYREQEVNHCPGCSHTHWYVGRMSAECAFCGTALPLEASKMMGQRGVSIQVRRRDFGTEGRAFAA